MLEEKLNLIPHLPGSYQMHDKTDKIIYVGKAKDLHKRVNSYFNRSQNGKTALMVSEICDITYITTNTETEAFLLEINLIKKYNPYYNILLKDDKTYPYIEYISKPYPQIKVARYLSLKKSDHKTVFGPYPNAYAARKIVTLLNRLYPLKKCDGMPKETCLYYSIGECLGYCTKNINQDKLIKMENEILSFLRGNDTILINKIMEKINFYSEQLNYESALELKNELQYIKVILNKQKVELHDYVNRDVIAYVIDNGLVSLEILFIRNGKLVGSHNNLFYLISDIHDEVASYLLDYYYNHEHPKEILIMDDCNNEILSNLLNLNVIIPLKGQKKALVKMALQNAKVTIENEITSINRNEDKTINANKHLGEILNIPNLHRIEVFDNSNLFGSFSVSGMVVFINGLPNKNEYRKYKISQDKNDDYHMMEEVIYRRYYRVLVDNLEKPDLILVDGGINQINACKSVLNSLNLKIKVCGLKKNDKHKTNDLIDGDTLNVIDLPKNDAIFLYLTRMQDEVHRYTINYHKQIRSKGALESSLEFIPGIGKIRRNKLIRKYGSLKKIKEAPINELEKIIPKDIAIKICDYLNK
jgi:excinuclease ABC subunit C